MTRGAATRRPIRPRTRAGIASWHFPPMYRAPRVAETTMFTGTISMAFTGRRVLVGGVMLWFAAMAHAQINPGGNDKPDGPTLDRLFAAFKSLVNRGNYQKMGFEVEKELAAAKPGTPIRLFMIQPDQLLAFTDATDPATVIEDAKQWVYPVLVGTDVRSGATVARQGTEGSWKLISAGDQRLARSIFQER